MAWSEQKVFAPNKCCDAQTLLNFSLYYHFDGGIQVVLQEKPDGFIHSVLCEQESIKGMVLGCETRECEDTRIVMRIANRAEHRSFVFAMAGLPRMQA